MRKPGGPWAGEMVEWLKVLGVLAEDRGWAVSYTHL